MGFPFMEGLEASVKRLFQTCPSCGKDVIEFRFEDTAREMCSACGFSADYVLFTCAHCNPDVFAVCPRKGCKGTPTEELCKPDSERLSAKYYR